MIKNYLNALVVLGLSWSVYGYCQEDMILPLVAGLIVIMTFLGRGRSYLSDFAVFEKIPVSALVIFSYLAGMVWRNFVPIPELAESPFPEHTAALQSGVVIASVLIWLRPFSRKNMFGLIFCAWLLVPLSMNVPFSSEMLIIFSTFCFAGVAVVILSTMRPPEGGKNLWRHIRDFIVFATLLIMLTTLSFFGISRAIVAMEEAFFNTMGNYILPRGYTNFLKISRQLNLINPGVSAYDRRMVMEVTLPRSAGAYLKMQVFQLYNNGTWHEPEPQTKDLLPSEWTGRHVNGRITMFAQFQDIVPTPPGVVAVRSRASYRQSVDGIIYSDQEKATQILDIALTRVVRSASLEEADVQKYLSLPPGISERLRDFSASLVGIDDDGWTKADKISEFLRKNFAYSLDVDFSADDKGLMRMLEERRPAYCTYFASAMALLLRSQGIPARVAAGFFTTERSGPQSPTFLVRVNHAHAWTEVLLPEDRDDPENSPLVWRTFDPTPPGFAVASAGQRQWVDLERLFERMWLNVLRFRASLSGIDKEQMKVAFVVLLLGMLLVMNRAKIIAALLSWRAARITPVPGACRTPGHLRKIYARYENFLRQEYGETRERYETDEDAVVRIVRDKNLTSGEAAALRAFLAVYQRARFGGTSQEDPAEYLPVSRRAHPLKPHT